MPQSRHSAGTYPETSSHATCQGTFGHSRLSSLSQEKVHTTIARTIANGVFTGDVLSKLRNQFSSLQPLDRFGLREGHER